MRRHEVYAIKRRALGLSQQQVAEKAGVTNSTVSTFELGKEVSMPVAKVICWVIDEEFKKLDKKDYLKALIWAEVTEICEEKYEENSLQTIGYLINNLGKLQLEILKSIKEKEMNE